MNIFVGEEMGNVESRPKFDLPGFNIKERESEDMEKLDYYPIDLKAKNIFSPRWKPNK